MEMLYLLKKSYVLTILKSQVKKTGQFYNYQNGMPQKTNASNVMPGPSLRNNVARGLNRYNDLATKYDRQRQSQQPK